MLEISKETLTHFQCSECLKWWTIGDAPEDKTIWFCPWCGHKHNQAKDAIELLQSWQSGSAEEQQETWQAIKDNL